MATTPGATSSSGPRWRASFTRTPKRTWRAWTRSRATRRSSCPKRTYKDKLTLGAGKDQIDLYHFGAGHTNGDTFIVYTALRTIQAGDMFPWKDAPFIDRSNGGSGRQWPLSLKKLLDGVKNVDTVIGGHQPVATWKDLGTFQQFTAELWSQTEAAHKAGKSVDEASANTAWIGKFAGYDTTRLKAAVQAIYDELSGK